MSTLIASTLRRIGAGVLAVASASSSGCSTTTATTGTPVYTRAAHRSPALYGYQVDYVEPPRNLDLYPRTYYRGGYAYLVNGRWYYETGGRWIVFRDEPRELYRYRVYDYARLEPGYQAPSHHYGTPRPPARPPGSY